MSIEIALREVIIEAGPVDNGDPEAPWLVGFRDPESKIAVSVQFTREQLRATAEAFIAGLDKGAVEPKPKIHTAMAIPRNIR